MSVPMFIGFLIFVYEFVNFHSSSVVDITEIVVRNFGMVFWSRSQIRMACGYSTFGQMVGRIRIDGLSVGSDCYCPIVS